MHIWVDADACPKVIKEILFRAAERDGIVMTLVANQAMVTPRLKNIRSLRVAAGFDMADNEIVKRLAAGDLVISRAGELHIFNSNEFNRLDFLPADHPASQQFPAVVIANLNMRAVRNGNDFHQLLQLAFRRAFHRRNLYRVPVAHAEQ